MLKTKRGRLWFIRCIPPVPSPPPDQDAVVAAYNAAKGGGQVNVTLPNPSVGQTLRPIRQPLYDSSPLKASSSSEKTLFNAPGIMNGHGYYAMTYNGREVRWVQHQDDAAGFDCREDAELRAFELATIAPWLLGKLEVVKLKTRRLSDVG